MIIKIRKKYFYYGAIILIIITIAFLFLYKSQKNEIYVDENGMMVVSSLKPLNYKTSHYESSENYTISKIIYNNLGKEVYGLLVEPIGNRIVPGIVLLPGAGVDKESELAFAKEISKEGYAVLTIDQRGVGETNGYVPSFEQDFNAYINGDIAIQHLMISDALAAADVLRKEKKLNPENIIMMGESLGGRIALISSAIDKKIKGIIAISTAGFHINGDNEQARFMKSLDPDNYIAEIYPRKIIMFHNSYDKNVNFESALATFQKAKEPKEFILINDTKCNHGFCDSMLPYIRSGLADIIG